MNIEVNDSIQNIHRTKYVHVTYDIGNIKLNFFFNFF
jgi:hypothetical protein